MSGVRSSWLMFARNSSFIRRASTTARYCRSSSAVRLAQRRIGAAQLLDQPRLLGRRGHLVGDDLEQPHPLLGESAGLGEIEGDRAEHVAARLQRERDERAELELLRDLLPVGERLVGEDIRHRHRAPLAHRRAARAEADAHAHVAEEGAELLRPVVVGGETERVLVRFVDQVDRREGRADERTDALERELEDVLGAVGGEEGVRDLADDHELADRRRGRRRAAGASVLGAGGLHEGESTPRRPARDRANRAPSPTGVPRALARGRALEQRGELRRERRAGEHHAGPGLPPRGDRRGIGVPGVADDRQRRPVGQRTQAAGSPPRDRSCRTRGPRSRAPERRRRDGAPAARATSPRGARGRARVATSSMRDRNIRSLITRSTGRAPGMAGDVMPKASGPRRPARNRPPAADVGSSNAEPMSRPVTAARLRRIPPSRARPRAFPPRAPTSRARRASFLAIMAGVVVIKMLVARFTPNDFASPSQAQRLRLVVPRGADGGRTHRRLVRFAHRLPRDVGSVDPAPRPPLDPRARRG